MSVPSSPEKCRGFVKRELSIWAACGEFVTNTKLLGDRDESD